ncbi:hypothetical protein F8A10_00550 [Paracoccus kondratievae]|uniref:hypothetical protein n=1 Tax=Paracoccus kondratievae TaxID=135740 RepID=UPI001266203F|nr:hypothetical protein [Paracoccus kondratievae]QFQ86035.1 hypothetical protein F8A10_00550 [Paracoccus kondratievae]
MTDTSNTTTVGHVALHYGKPEDGPLTAKLFKLMGFVTREETAYPDGTVFHYFLVDPHAINAGDGILFLVPRKNVPRALYDAIRKTFRANQQDEDEVVNDSRAAARENPELGVHVGFLKSSLEELEGIVQRVQHVVA